MGVVRLRWWPYAHMFIHPHTSGHPHIFGHPIYSESFNRVILLYIKCFPTLLAVMGGCSRLMGVHMPPMFITPPIHLDITNMFSKFNGIFILLFHEMFSYFRGSNGGLSDLGGTQMLHMFIYVLYVSKPPYIGHPHMFGCLSYVWMPPVCLDVPCISRHPHIFRWPIHFDTPCV